VIRTALAIVLMSITAAASAQLTLYQDDNFQGKQFDVRGAVDNLANSGFNDTASSVRVRHGTWQVCDDAYFRGKCITLQPGDYPSLGNFGMNDRVSSARDIGGYGPPPSHGGNWGGGARAVLYEHRDFGGRSYVIDGNVVRDLANTGFNDRASSLRVEQGYWMFCSDSNFEGQCQTFGPGEYAELPRSLTNRISSGRRISSQYPYRQNPDWNHHGG
jgi:hypothetical protein